VKSFSKGQKPHSMPAIPTAYFMAICAKALRMTPDRINGMALTYIDILKNSFFEIRR
jgi:hypothetical protein